MPQQDRYSLTGRICKTGKSYFAVRLPISLLLLCIFPAGELPAIWKTLLFLLFIAPPALAMGMPFPLGLEQLANHSKSQAAWAWGINGCVSVVSTGLAAIVAVEFGFSAVMLTACAAYGLAALAALMS